VTEEVSTRPPKPRALKSRPQMDFSLLKMVDLEQRRLRNSLKKSAASQEILLMSFSIPE
jgi:hypothetical protein